MDKLTLISGSLFVAADVFAIMAIILPDWIVSEVGGETRLGLIQSCLSLYGRKQTCFVPHLESEWMMTLICIISGCLCVTGAVILLALSSWNMRVISYARWVGFAAMVLFCLAAVIFPMGFSEKSIGGEPYQLPSSHQVGVSYIFFVLSLWITVISELFAGKDLVAEDEEKNWKGICIAIFVIATIISLIVTAIIILSPVDEGPRVRHPRISLDDIVSDAFQPKEFDGSWASDTEVVYKNSDGALVIFSAADNSTHTIVPNTTLRQYTVQKYRVSADQRYVLLIHEIRKIFHFSYTAKYKIYNVTNEHVFPLEAPGGNQDLQYCEWGPKGNQLMFIHQNNIYYYPSIGDNLKSLVKTGKEGILFNGIPDWLYGEKILKTNKAIWWAPDGGRLGFASFDDSRVDTMSYPKYGTYDDPNNVYPEMVSLRYPKAGRENPVVTLWVIDLRNPSNIPGPKRLIPPTEITGRDHYFTALSWIDKERMAVVWMRREQNYSVVSLCSAEKGWACEKHLEERIESESSGWVELFDPPLITSDKRHYLLRLPMNDGEAGAFRQIAMITINGRVKNFLTQGLHDVTRILAHRHDSRTVFYEATLVGQPGERHIFSIPDIHSSLPRISACLTCNQTERNCSFHEATFSPSADFFILQCLGPGVPWTEVRSVDGNEIIMRTDEDKQLLEIMEERAFPQMRSFRVPLGKDYFAEVNLILPPALREYEEIRFPLVVEFVPEPGEQGVSRKFHVDWGLYLASNRDFIYARIDVRGSRYQGDKVLHQTWHRLGTIEVEDYIEVVRYLKSALHFVDPARTAIWGWAYGGYIAAAALGVENQNIFNCSIAVAPITNWLYVETRAVMRLLIQSFLRRQDSFTSERYFGQPWSPGNFIRYEKADLSQKAFSLRDRKLFILHGTADDAVHLQHSFTFMKSLNDAGVIYRSQLYPDSNHYLEDVRYHLYRSMELYLLECFKLEEGWDLIDMQTNKKSAHKLSDH